jgi:serine phosphatase RsbU (regulator of sigma subunit)
MVRTLSQRLNHSENLTIRDLRRKNRQLMQAYQELEAAQALLIEKERLERELEVARDIQGSILPSQLPQHQGYGFGALMEPMSAVGGDFYDFIPLGGDRLGIAIGDVSDHGVPAALFMAMTVTLLRAEARRASAPSPVEILLNVNKQLLTMNQTGIFVTMLYGELDLKNRLFSYVRAGHEIPVVCNAQGDLSELPKGKGQLMGILENPVLDENQMQLSPGCTLFMFTDGVNEAANAEGALFGRNQLCSDLATLRDAPAQDLCNSILQSVESYRDGDPQQDDITMVAVTVK